MALEEISPEIVSHQAESLPYGGNYHGHDGFKQFATKLGATWQQQFTAVEEFIDAGDKVIVRERLKAQAKGNGKEINVPVIEIFTVRDEKIVGIEVFYWDTAAVLQALA